MKLYAILLCLVPLCLWSQKDLDKVLQKYNDESIPYIQVEELAQLLESNHNIKLLDTRAASEYSISHIQKSIYAGYEDFDMTSIQNQLKKQDTIIVYCSIGVRSEHIGKQLQKAGYTRVFNLYGGIFEWVNNGLQVYDHQNQLTKKIHAYDRFWGRYLENGLKVY